MGQLAIEHSMFLGQYNSGTALTIVESNVNMTETVFHSYVIGKYRSDTRFFRYPMTTVTYSDSVTASVGGALIVTHSTVVIDKCQFEGNRANIGGAIFSECESNITISNSEFTSNQATGCVNGLCFGGALFIDGTSSVSINNSTFQNNTSDQDGGMVVVFNATLSVSQSYAYNNTAARYGGTVATFQDGVLTFDAILFSYI